MWPLPAAYFFLSRLLIKWCLGKLRNHKIKVCNIETETEIGKRRSSSRSPVLIEFEHLMQGILWCVTSCSVRVLLFLHACVCVCVCMHAHIGALSPAGKFKSDTHKHTNIKQTAHVLFSCDVTDTHGTMWKISHDSAGNTIGHIDPSSLYVIKHSHFLRGLDYWNALFFIYWYGTYNDRYVMSFKRFQCMIYWLMFSIRVAEFQKKIHSIYCWNNKPGPKVSPA